jgi:hypothetical protein
VILVALSAAFLAAVAFACIVGTHTYQSQRAATVGLRPAAAVTAPDIAGASAGARISVWLNQSGQPAAPPADRAVMIIYALVASAMVGGSPGWCCCRSMSCAAWSWTDSG